MKCENVKKGNMSGKMVHIFLDIPVHEPRKEEKEQQENIQ